MSYELIITEKPAAMTKIAEALADGKAIKKSNDGVPYYEVTHGKKDIVVTCAVGHLFTVTVDGEKKWTYPIFTIKWEQSSKVNKESKFTAKYVSSIKKLAKDATSFVVATDFDIEGEVIGYNILKFLCKKTDARRMKFSTLTKDELRESYEHALPHIEWGQASAGLTRHELDWYYGINLSRALSQAMKEAGRFKILSSGRVQGPALKIVVDLEKQIQAFKPVPYWEMQLLGSIKTENIEAWHIDGKIFEKNKADAILAKTKSAKEGRIAEAETKQFEQHPPTPFDLTTLQTEAYRALRIKPKQTLELAQSLYLAGAISYPRTSSQQLPPSIGYKKILTALGKQKIYQALTTQLLSKSKLAPYNGKKTDPAHPAIYPTGSPANVNEQELRLYDLIVKRFLATFADPAKRETATLKIDVNTELFVAKGTRTVFPGWHLFYLPYISFEEQQLPSAKEGDRVTISSITQLEKETQPPKRYTQASIIKELERKNLGTKSTRAQVVDTLYQRGYVSGEPLEATSLGIHTIETLEKYCEQIIDEGLTRHFEEEMEEIREQKKEGKEVLTEARDVLTKVLTEFKKKEKEIGEGLLSATREAEFTANTIGQCPNCQGTLLMKKGKFGRFVACDKYPDCKTTFKVPAQGLVKASDKICELCKHPMIKIIKHKNFQELCINLECKSKLSTPTQTPPSASEVKNCSLCGKPMILRKSVYGQFWGCSGYPACKKTEKV